MKESGKVRMLEIYWGESQVKCQCKIICTVKGEEILGRKSIASNYTHVGLDIMRKPEEGNAF